MANCSNCIKHYDCCSAGKMSGYCGGYSPAKITNQEAILFGKIPLEHIVCGFNRLCGRCQTDRKICNAELNCECGRQWLRAEYKADFICDYKKPGVN